MTTMRKLFPLLAVLTLAGLDISTAEAAPSAVSGRKAAAKKRPQKKAKAKAQSSKKADKPAPNRGFEL
jgi:hypothetical protein